MASLSAVALEQLDVVRRLALNPAGGVRKFAARFFLQSISPTFVGVHPRGTCFGSGACCMVHGAQSNFFLTDDENRHSFPPLQ